MKNVLRVSHSDCTIIMDRTFAKLSENTMSAEYKKWFLERFPEIKAFGVQQGKEQRA